MWLTSGYRDAMITIACFNFALMTPAVFLMKARLPPHRPPPLNSMKGPWRQPQYVFLVLGAALYTMKCVPARTQQLTAASCPPSTTRSSTPTRTTSRRI